MGPSGLGPQKLASWAFPTPSPEFFPNSVAGLYVLLPVVLEDSLENMLF